MSSVIAWFARNSVVANLLMFVIVAVGAITLPDIKKEVFPEITPDVVSVKVDYRGAAPEEVEEGVCIRVEEAVQDLEGVKKITSTANEGSGTVTIEVEQGYDTRRLLDDVKSRIDAIDTFPEETEQPIVQEITVRTGVINLSIAGDADELTLKNLGEEIREELLQLPMITQIDLTNARAYEISIEVSEEALRRYNLTFDFVANAVRRSSLDLPGGSLRTERGEILLRTKGQAYVGRDFEDLTLLTRPDGSKLLLSDVATVVDGFEQTDNEAYLNGRRAVTLQIFRVGDQNAIEIADEIYAFIERRQPTLPEGIYLTAWMDNARMLKGRMNLLLRNARSGLILVFVILTLFLRLRLAFWVCLGIPVSFLGALAVMPHADVSINVMSLFAFILVLGIVVDDAIVVGEAVFEEQERTRQGMSAAISATKQVSTPVIFGVLTTVAAFAPLWFVPGVMGKFFRVMPWVVVPTLLFSLVESQLVLPSHLSHYHEPKDWRRGNTFVRAWNGFFRLFSEGLKLFVRRVYQPALRLAVEWRYLTVAVALSTLLLTAGLVGGGMVKMIFMPEAGSDNVVADLTMPQETPAHVTREAIRKIEAAGMEALREVEEAHGSKQYKHVLSSVGEQPFRAASMRFAGGQAGASRSNEGEINIELIPSEVRSVEADEVARRWRAKIPQIADVVELTITSNMLNSGDAIDIQFAGEDIRVLQKAVAEAKQVLAEYPGVIDISDSFRGGKPEIKLDITSKAESLGLTLQDLGRQVRQGFFGEEAQRIQRGRDDIRVMVRYPEQDRTSIGDLEQMRVRTPDGGEVPFSTVATATMGRGFSTIRRVDRRRTINVTADVDLSTANANDVLADLDANYLPALVAKYPGIRYSFEGQQREQFESMSSLFKGFGVAMFVIYALIAIPFGSYVQPLIVMSAVPFGIVGAIWGHAFLGLNMSLLSMFGVVALSGVVVNDSLVLVSFINHHRNEGGSLKEAVIRAGMNRFRPILLTSLTTAAGVTPLMLEKEIQAQFLIPMAVSLAFGVLFSTFITLALVPALYVILEDFAKFWKWLRGAPVRVDEIEEEEASSSERERLEAARGALEPVSGD